MTDKSWCLKLQLRNQSPVKLHFLATYCSLQSSLTRHPPTSDRSEVKLWGHSVQIEEAWQPLAALTGWEYRPENTGNTSGKRMQAEENTECVTKKKKQMCIHACIWVCACFLRPSRGGKFSQAIIRPQITALRSQKSPLLGPHQQPREDSTPHSNTHTHTGKTSQPQIHHNAFSRRHTGPSSEATKYFTDEQKRGSYILCFLSCICGAAAERPDLSPFIASQVC